MKCQSKNHSKSECEGEIWECEKCKRKFCYQDGGSENNLCDSCHANQKLFVVHINEIFIGEVIVPAKDEEEAKAKFWELTKTCDSSCFSLETSGYEIIDVNDTDKEEAQANGWVVMED